MYQVTRSFTNCKYKNVTRYDSFKSLKPSFACKFSEINFVNNITIESFKSTLYIIDKSLISHIPLGKLIAIYISTSVILGGISN